MNVYPDLIKHNLLSIISDMSSSLEFFVKNPGIDFSRNRKLPFDSVLMLLISMGGNSICKELLDFQGYNSDTVSSSAFIQQRDKILPSAFEFLLQRFTQSFSDIRKYRDYRLLAVDGSDLNIAHDPNSPDTYFKNHLGYKGFNLLHLNALFDLCNKLYIDAFIQPRRKANENIALVNMVDRSCIDGKVILIGDRGYESYNNFAHIENKGWNYLIRVKDSKKSGILSVLQLPTSPEFDISIQRILTKSNSTEVKDHPDIYKLLSYKTNFDFIDLDDNKFYPISFRVVRFKITDDSYETVITNLAQSDFPPHELKKLYGERWGIESSFRDLKYSVGLVNFHAKKQEYIIQEVFARIIMYNFALMITSHVIISQNDTRHIYQVNIKVAIQVCRYFLRLRNNAPPPDVEAIIHKNILPVRPGRKYLRKTISRGANNFIYRVA